MHRERYMNGVEHCFPGEELETFPGRPRPGLYPFSRLENRIEIDDYSDHGGEWWLLYEGKGAAKKALTTIVNALRGPTVAAQGLRELESLDDLHSFLELHLPTEGLICLERPAILYVDSNVGLVEQSEGNLILNAIVYREALRLSRHHYSRIHIENIIRDERWRPVPRLTEGRETRRGRLALNSLELNAKQAWGGTAVICDRDIVDNWLLQ